MPQELDDLERSLPLPEFLELEQPYGEIRLTGHRILLPHVVRLYAEGYSPAMLWERFPTLSLSHIHKVIAYYLDHQQLIDRYMALRDAEIDRQAAAHPARFSLPELRKRRAESTAKDFV
jgi:uncharacterized protein (DUF433 family)